MNLPANSDHLEEFHEAQQSDPPFVKFIQFCQSQWPGRSRIEDNLVPYWRMRSELSVVDGLLCLGHVLLYQNVFELKLSRKFIVNTLE